MFNDILVPTDGSACADTAVEHARDLATRYEATVHVLSVVDSRTLENAPHQTYVEEQHTEIANAANDEFAEVGLSTESTVLTDIPHRAILEYAAEHDIDLIIMGTRGRTGLEQYLLGSITEKVVRLSDTPVLTVPPADTRDVTYPYSDVLIPTDGSKWVTAAIDLGTDLASTYGARLHAFSVVDTAGLGLDVRSESILGILEEDAESAVATVEERATQTDVSEIITAVEYGQPYQEILSYIDANEIDIVVMGTHGRSDIERYLLGSVAEKLIRTAPVPVMTVRMPDSQGE